MVSLSRSSYSSRRIGFFLLSSHPFMTVALPALLVEVQPLPQVEKTVGASKRPSATVSHSPKFEVPPRPKEPRIKFGSHHVKLTSCCYDTLSNYVGADFRESI